MLGMKKGGNGKEALTMTVSHLWGKNVPVLMFPMNSPLWTILSGFTSKNHALWRDGLACVDWLPFPIAQRRLQCRRVVAL